MKKEVVIRGHQFNLKTWNYGEKQRALRAATTFEEKSGVFVPEVDPFTLNDHMLVICLETWDLKDKDGLELPISIDNIHQIEPPELVEELIAICQEMNGVSVEERKK